MRCRLGFLTLLAVLLRAGQLAAVVGRASIETATDLASSELSIGTVRAKALLFRHHLAHLLLERSASQLTDDTTNVQATTWWPGVQPLINLTDEGSTHEH